MRRISFCLLIGLGACNTPHPEFRGITAQRITIAGSTFDIRVADKRAEAIRINAEYAPRFGPIRARAVKAMELVSGCNVARITGDQAQAFGDLQCGNDPPPPPVRGPVEYDCYQIDAWQSPGLGHELAEYDCERV